jgi:predicted O-methyltransferase YrrM
LDADKEDYQTHFDNAWRLLKKSGVIFVDNLLWHGYAALDEIPDDAYIGSTDHIRKFNAMFMNHPDLKTTIITVGDGIGLGIKQ